jgi:hypothetical protein
VTWEARACCTWKEKIIYHETDGSLFGDASKS